MSELKRLQLLVELERHGTIAAVSSATSYSTSGISQQLAVLEREIGAALFEPDGRRIRLTAAGHAVLAHAGGVLNAWENARAAALADAPVVEGVMTLAVFQTAFIAWVPGMLHELGSRHPRVQLRVRQAEPEQAVPALLARDVDAAIVERYPGSYDRPDERLAHHTLSEDPMLLAVPAARRNAELRDLGDLPWVFEARGSAVRLWADRVCHEAGFAPDIRYETSDVLSQLELVAHAGAAAFVPGLMPERFRSAIVTRELPGHRRTLQFVTRAGATDTPIVRAVREAAVVSAGGAD